MRQKGQLVIVQIVTLIPLGIKLCFVFGLGFQSHELFPVFSKCGRSKMLSIMWNSWASTEKETTTAPLPWWCEGKVNKLPRGLC